MHWSEPVFGLIVLRADTQSVKAAVLLRAEQDCGNQLTRGSAPARSGLQLTHHGPRTVSGRHNGVMPSSPQHPAPTPTDVSGADAEDLALYREKFRRRLPESLDELRGPTRGVVDLPLHMAWSGMTSYDLGKPRQRMGLYRTVLHEGLHDDLPRYLDQDLLLQLWPVLRTLVGRTVRAVWEDAFPQLASRTRAAA